jgi:DNA-binding response OmpR family regulator
MKNKILIIEDDAFLGEALSKKLDGEGYEVILISDGTEALPKMREIRPDLVLLDIVLPHMNGYEILEAKSKDAEIASIPVIIISNSGQPVEISRVLSFGVKDYLVKAQFDPDEVVSKIRMYLSNQNNSEQKTDAGNNVSSLDGRTVLWIEDDAFLSDIIAKKLSGVGCNLIHASTGEDALKLITDKKPDVIMLDVLLPGMDGFEILRRIKLDENTASVPVIMLSNLSQESDFNKARELGASLFMVKAAMSLDEIVEKIKSVLS